MSLSCCCWLEAFWLDGCLLHFRLPRGTINHVSLGKRSISARFADDQRTVIYSSSHTGDEAGLFSVTPDSLVSVGMNLKSAHVAAISAGEMLVIQPRFSSLMLQSV